MAAAGAPEGYVLVAEEQTAGKGRLGRSFHSPANHGVYFSLLLKPGIPASDAALITPSAAVAVALAIEEVYGVKVGIKWVNDLLADGKKVCGILTETVIGAQSGLVEIAVLGIGVNVTRPETGYPDDIKTVAAALTDGTRSGDRCRLVAAILDNTAAASKTRDGSLPYFSSGPDKEDPPSWLAEYRARSVVLGQDIYVISGDGRRAAKAIAVDDACGLVVQYEDGENATLNSGEVSIRVD